MKLEKSLRRIRQVVTRPGVFHMLCNLTDIDDYMPNPIAFHFVVGDGLVIYEPKGYAVEMFAAVSPSDLPKHPVQTVHAQWDYLAEQGFNRVFAVVRKSNLRSSMMCRACGMDKTEDDLINFYTKVIYGRR